MVGNAIFGISRPDVCRLRHGRGVEVSAKTAAPGECSAVGFVYLLDTRGLAPGSHTLTVSTAAASGAPGTESWTINFDVTTSGDNR
jgi:hypothetical protein